MRLAAGLRPDPLGELKRSPRPRNRNKGPTSKGRGRGGEGRGREGRGRGEEGKGKGEREGKGMIFAIPILKCFRRPSITGLIVQNSRIAEKSSVH